MRHPKPQEWDSTQYSQGYYGDYKPFNFVDGEGVRCSLYVSGRLFACKGCYNKAVQNFKYGKPYTKELEDQIIADLAHDYVQGMTLLGESLFKHRGLFVISDTYTPDVWSHKRYLGVVGIYL